MPNYHDYLQIIVDHIINFRISVDTIKQTFNENIINDIINVIPEMKNMLNHLFFKIEDNDINDFTYSVPLFEYYVKNNKFGDAYLNPKVRCLKMNILIKNSDIDILEYIYSNGYIFTGNDITECLQSGSITAIEFLCDIGLYPLFTDMIYNVAISGNIACIDYFIQKFPDVDIARLYLGAAKSGNLECVKYVYEFLHKIIEQKKQKQIKQLCLHKEIICEHAAESGNVDCLVFVHKNGGLMTQSVTEIAIQNNNIECLKYAVENGASINPPCIRYAAKNNNFEMIKYIHSLTNCAAESRITFYFAENGNLDALIWCHNNGIMWDRRLTAMVVQKGHMDCLKYAHENGCPWSNEFLYQTSIEASGKIEFLRYIHKNGCPISISTLAYAVLANNKECVQYCLDNRFPFSTLACQYAVKNNNLEFLKILHMSGCPWDEETCTEAAINGNIECLKYAHENGCPWNELVITQAVLNGHDECLQYAMENECPQLTTIKYD